MSNKEQNAVIYVQLLDGQHLGHIQLREGQPYYGYSRPQATRFTLSEAKKLCNRLAKTYKLTIEMPKEYKPKKTKERISVVYI